ncbi:Xylose transport system permease protein XylH [Clostridium sp. N3C]|uniref:sugar ABC transporter permease n=1 Tax=Clostridium sp. N3C TaxID=1776758 RepID=UPI00092DEB0C|nr:sugar ABC transporter permease [Clostridium sp. N3C]SCN22691.1 Xylose transport system permease protein XylH [Clostridium sp. N3C]
MELLKEAKQLIKQNIREYGMYIALVFIMIIFSITTGGLFTSSRNISNLINQNGYIAVLTVGMTLVLIICNIDLSVGYAAGFLGAVAAILLTQYNLPVFVVVPLVLILGIIIGLCNGILVGKVKIPAFVVTLAGMMIFRGALLLITEGTGTIIIPNKTFNAIGNGFIPDIVKGSDIHILTLIIGGLAILFYIWSQFKTRKNNIKYNFKVVSMKMFILKVTFISIIIAYLTWILANYNGLSWTTVVVAIVVAIYHFITNKTQLGRHIYAVGGNIEAAKLSGINVNKITYIVFASMGMLAALAGILYTARLQSATTVAGTGFEMDAIAAAYVGGVSAAGGVGKITGSIIGALVIASMTNGMNLMGVGIHYQYIIKGLVLVVAVAFDIQTRKKRK